MQSFKKKCLGKMESVSKSQGRTILFVSHNLPAVEALCKKGLLLNKGRLVHSGSVHDTIVAYLNNNRDTDTLHFAGKGIIKSARVLNEGMMFKYNCALTLEVVFESAEKIKSVVLGVVIKDL